MTHNEGGGTIGGHFCDESESANYIDSAALGKWTLASVFSFLEWQCVYVCCCSNELQKAKKVKVMKVKKVH